MASNELRVHQETGIQVERTGKTNAYKKHGWLTQQRRTNRTYSRSEYLLSGALGKDRDQCHQGTKMDGHFGDAMASSPKPRD